MCNSTSKWCSTVLQFSLSLSPVNLLYFYDNYHLLADAFLQLDFQLPCNFKLEYSTEDEAKSERPVMIHRAILGSVERMFAIFLEHYKGKWPFWLSPRQAIVCPVSEKSQKYAIEVVYSRSILLSLFIDLKFVYFFISLPTLWMHLHIIINMISGILWIFLCILAWFSPVLDQNLFSCVVACFLYLAL